MRVRWITSLACLAAGCMSLSNVDPAGAKPPGPGEGIVVIGSPGHVVASFDPGEVVDGVFRVDAIPGSIAGTSVDGYVVRRLKATQGTRRYALVDVHVNGRAFFASCNQEIMAIHVEPGTVNYFGHIGFEQSTAKTLAIRHRMDLDAAVRHIDRTYPGLRGMTKAATPTMVRKGC